VAKGGGEAEAEAAEAAKAAAEDNQHMPKQSTIHRASNWGRITTRKKKCHNTINMATLLPRNTTSNPKSGTVGWQKGENQGNYKGKRN
jgi:hypothetical protein